ncbi:hypothetical protein [Methylopila sp. M107]|uniref:hypothetical protein n=1 Tax=Methylopila sp. M107 TaxID=1101190 RepID=UPI00036D2E70|nr:hypothetical protein [Methylopila sp. M107]
MTTSSLRLLAVAGIAAILSGCAGDRVWMRSASSSSDAEIDEMDCGAQAESSGVSISSDGATGFSPDRFSNRYACLRSRGYKLKSLTAEEAAKLKSLGGVDREVYWNELLAKNGFRPATPKPAEGQAGAAPLAPKPTPAR